MVTPQRRDRPRNPKLDSDFQTDDTTLAPRGYEMVYYSYNEAFKGECRESSQLGPKMCR